MIVFLFHAQWIPKKNCSKWNQWNLVSWRGLSLRSTTCSRLLPLHSDCIFQVLMFQWNMRFLTRKKTTQYVQRQVFNIAAEPSSIGDEKVCWLAFIPKYISLKAVMQVTGGILADIIGKYVNLIASRSGLLSSIASIPRYQNCLSWTTASRNCYVWYRLRMVVYSFEIVTVHDTNSRKE